MSPLQEAVERLRLYVAAAAQLRSYGYGDKLHVVGIFGQPEGELRLSDLRTVLEALA